jgi:hypothetical protein
MIKPLVRRAIDKFERDWKYDVSYIRDIIDARPRAAWLFSRATGLLAAAVLFGGLVHVVLAAAHVSEPAATTVYGPTPRRLWATAAAGLALVGVVIGGLALRRSAGRIGTGNGRMGAIVALVAGLIAGVNGGLNLAIATGGPGTGNGVVGGAVALVLGLIGMVLGGLALARSRRPG